MILRLHQCSFLDISRAGIMLQVKASFHMSVHPPHLTLTAVRHMCCLALGREDTISQNEPTSILVTNTTEHFYWSLIWSSVQVPPNALMLSFKKSLCLAHAAWTRTTRTKKTKIVSRNRASKDYRGWSLKTVVQRSNLKAVNIMYRDERRNQITVEKPGSEHSSKLWARANYGLYAHSSWFLSGKENSGPLINAGFC